ncbi:MULTISPECIES: multidrug effflux MFS transporter [unclassified Duganella]|uniref:multidrug effflux MFS transporter n=1 Tax=unclassified Duganella TaxID=2636909 RepID=UPI00088ED437|nr:MULTISPECIES: multidrug effflux MFS transporter [unclassified Duganella]SDG52403.1 MFS transporter, DHA1 family, bicyclomycin/chloramphenicol resistance protein [Duganella sp. OV458]SDJ75181.1 MFS transporter, DHA1 family, bicyclomycin/chloramphenicol resistance protein [Duganella sp. OV510]
MNILLTLLLAGLSMVGPLAIDTYLPSFPAITQAFDASPLVVQQTLSMFLFCFSFMMLFYGTLSDSFGRRPVILVSLVAYIIASVVAAMAPSIGVLLACRIVQGLAAGAGSVVGRAIVLDRFDGAAAQKILSHIMMVFGLAPAIAPVLGGWLQVGFGWRSIFWFLAAFGLLMLVSVYRALPESLPAKDRHPFHPGVIAKNYWKVLCHYHFLLLAVAVGMSFAGVALYIGSAAYFVMNILHLPETAFAWMFVPLISGMVVGSALSGKFAHRFSRKAQVWAGFVVMLSAGVINVAYNATFTAAVPWAVLPLFIYSFGLALAMTPASLIALSYFPNNSGLASSMQSFIQMLLFALVSGLVAPLLFDSALNLAWGVLASLVISVIAWMLALIGKPVVHD